MRVGDLMHRGESIPRVLESTRMSDAIYEMTRKSLGMTAVTDERGILVGVISDGDLRRMLQKSPDPLNLPAGRVMSKNPRTISEDELATVALSRMEELKITSLVVIDKERAVIGVVHVHDLWRTQLF
jgi:arabinose-5-phosphate isomerase